MPFTGSNMFKNVVTGALMQMRAGGGTMVGRMGLGTTDAVSDASDEVQPSLVTFKV
jgi:hypothetical protein